MESLFYLKNHGVIALSKQSNFNLFIISMLSLGTEKDMMMNHSGQKSETLE
jgi:hypothetical protein